MQRIPGRDAHYLYEERAHHPLHTLKILVLDPPEDGSGAPDAQAVRAALAPRIAALAPLRNVLVRVPLRAFHPLWRDGGMPDLDVHIRTVRSAAPGGEPELSAELSRLANGRLPRDRPLWELWVIDGLDDGRVALALKLHHSVADGTASALLIEALFGLDGDPPRAAHPPRPEVPPGRARLLAGALPALGATIARAPGLMRRGRRAAANTRRLREEGMVATAPTFSGPRMAWNAPPTGRRAVAFASVPAADVAAVAYARRCTIGDVVVAATAGALRGYLEDRDALPAMPLTVCVPISARPPGADPWGNHVASAFIALPTPVGEPLARLDAVYAAMSGVRAHRAELDVALWDDLWELYPLFRAGYMAALAAARLRRSPPTYNLIVTVVRGPTGRLGVGGAVASELRSIGPLSEDLGLNVTAWTHGDRISFGVIACVEPVPDLDMIAEGLPAALAQLAAATESEGVGGDLVEP